MEWQVYTYDSCQLLQEEGRGGSKKTGAKFTSCFFTLQTTTRFYWEKGRISKRDLALPLSIFP